MTMPTPCDPDSLAPLRLCVRISQTNGTTPHTPQFEGEISGMLKEVVA